MRRQVYDEKSGAILFKRSEDGTTLDKLRDKVKELESKNKDLEDRIKKLESLIKKDS